LGDSLADLSLRASESRRQRIDKFTKKPVKLD